jgi:hypothetical protein
MQWCRKTPSVRMMCQTARHVPSIEYMRMRGGSDYSAPQSLAYGPSRSRSFRMRRVQEMWIRRMPGRRKDHGGYKSAVSTASGFGASQFTHRADPGSCGLSVWLGRYGLRARDCRTGCTTSAGSGKSSELHRYQRESLTIAANRGAIHVSRLRTPAVIEPNANTNLPYETPI